jgi:hypothetical protein
VIHVEQHQPQKSSASAKFEKEDVKVYCAAGYMMHCVVYMDHLGFTVKPTFYYEIDDEEHRSTLTALGKIYQHPGECKLDSTPAGEAVAYIAFSYCPTSDSGTWEVNVNGNAVEAKTVEGSWEYSQDKNWEKKNERSLTTTAWRLLK